MRSWIASSLVLLMVLAVAPAVDAQTGTALLNIFFSAKRNANLEPCGCHVSAQGGISYETPIYTDHSRGLLGIRVDAGNWSDAQSPGNPVSAMQSRVILLALEAMQYDAINVGLQDVRMPADFIGVFGKKHPGAVEPLVSANIYVRSEPGKLAFKPYRIVERKLADGKMYRIGVTGVTDVDVRLPGVEALNPQAAGGAIAQTAGYIIKDPIAALQPVMAELQSKTDLIVVLHAGNFKGAQSLIRAVQEITYLITTAPPPDGTSVQYPVSGAIMLFVIHGSGRQIGKMTLRPRAPGWEFESRPEVIDVKPLPKADANMSKIVGEFYKISGKDTVSTQTTPVRTYAGAFRCITCHNDPKNPIYNKWKATPHAHAMDKLVIEDEQFNPDKLKRATTGYGEPGGFKHARQLQSLFFMNVQCEACHGAALPHVEAENRIKQPGLTPEEKTKTEADIKKTMPPKQVPEATCLKCHDKAFDPNFNYARDYAKVKH